MAKKIIFVIWTNQDVMKAWPVEVSFVKIAAARINPVAREKPVTTTSFAVTEFVLNVDGQVIPVAQAR
jgi:hypothetical protein